MQAFRRLYEEVGLGWVYVVTKYEPVSCLLLVQWVKLPKLRLFNSQLAFILLHVMSIFAFACINFSCDETQLVLPINDCKCVHLMIFIYSQIKNSILCTQFLSLEVMVCWKIGFPWTCEQQHFDYEIRNLYVNTFS